MEKPQVIPLGGRGWSVFAKPRRFRVSPVGVVVAFIAALLSIGRLHAAETSLETPIELRPYRVQVLVAFDTPMLGDAGKSELLEQTRQVAVRCIGAQWQATIGEAAWLSTVSPQGLKRLTAAAIAEKAVLELGQFDVWIVATVQSNGSGWRVDVRSWQPELQLESQIVGDDCYDRTELALTLLRLCHSSFRPVGVVDDADAQQAHVMLQAGALAVPDPTFSLENAARLFVPILASRKRDKSIDRLQTIPWTYLSARETVNGRVTCDLQSGLRAAVGGKQRGRIETLAVAVKPTFPSTQLQLANQAKTSLPLVAHRIELRKTSEFPKPEDAGTDDARLIRVLLTDRRGRVIIPADDTTTVVWLFAYSGTHLLARVPIVPGIASTTRLEVPDDSVRLAAESDLYMLQGELIEAVAARNTAAAAVRIAIKKNDTPLAKKAMEELRKLPDAQIYLDRVTAIRVPAVKAAQQRKDRAGEVRINRMCDEMRDLINQYLSEDKRSAVAEEMKELFREEDAPEKDKPE